MNKEAVRQALCACFGLEPSSDEAYSLLSETCLEPENAPRLPRHADAVFYTLEPDPLAEEAPPAYASRNPSAASALQAVSRFSAWKLILVCYGPHAPENAEKVRSFLYLDGAGFPRAILRKAGIRPVPGAPGPTVLHEPEGTLWRLRADLAVSLMAEETLEHPLRRNAVTVPPAVRLHT